MFACYSLRTPTVASLQAPVEMSLTSSAVAYAQRLGSLRLRIGLGADKVQHSDSADTLPLLQAVPAGTAGPVRPSNPLGQAAFGVKIVP